MPVNVHPDYIQAESDYDKAITLEEKLKYLRKMISVAPGHKGAENLRQQLTTRRKKIEAQIIKVKRSGKSTTIGIRKDDMQGVIIGKTNSGKSSLLKKLTNANPKVSEHPFMTTEPVIGMMPYLGTQVQLIENPSIDGDNFDKGLIHTTDTLLILITNLKELKEIESRLTKSKAKKIIVFNKSDKLSTEEKRKLKATLQSKKYNFVITSLIPHWPDSNIDELKKRIFESFDILKIYTKEPGKDKSKRPIIMKPNSTVKDVAERILKGFSKRVKETKIWGPSSKFGGQKIGLSHKLKDMDVLEFKTN